MTKQGYKLGDDSVERALSEPIALLVGTKASEVFCRHTKKRDRDHP